MTSGRPLIKQEWVPLFYEFLKYVRINSKEVQAIDKHGAPLNLWPGQKIAIDTIIHGLERGVHTFMFGKARQQGISTLFETLDIFWLATHDSMMGAYVIDKGDNIPAIRDKIRRFFESFPPGFFGKKFQILSDNKEFMTFSNGSRLDFLTAGVGKKETNWGEGRGYTFVHLTEVAKYGNPDGLGSFRSTLSEANPDRLYIYESTSKGVNHWKTLLEEFKRDEFNKAWAFIGWWGNPYNIIKENQPAFGVYGAAEPDPLEQELIDKVKKDYGFKVSQEQLAWYRHKHSEISASDAAMKQNLPWCIEESFVLTGHSFFPMHMLQDEMERCRTTGYKGFRYLIGNDFWSVVCEQIYDDDRQREIVLKVWEEPDDDGIYAIGCDPAYGRSEDKDRHSISVWRCFGDKIVQVAEYADNETSTRQCAWVLAHLAGAYRNCVVNVEAAPGPGGVIMNELENLREQIRIDPKFDSIDANKQNANWSDFLSTSRWYIFKKPDHFAPGFVKGWESNFRTKVQLMEQMRDKFVTGNMIAQSFSLIDEMTNVIRNGDSIGAPESAYDDRVIAAALANRAWMDSLMMSLLGQGETYEQYLRVKNGEPIDKGSKFMSNVIREFFLNAEEKANVPQIPPHQQWLYDKGLL